ncbi:hypothetical protein AAHC03_013242 [Spirometra sp. Aus1]
MAAEAPPSLFQQWEAPCAHKHMPAYFTVTRLLSSVAPKNYFTSSQTRWLKPSRSVAENNSFLLLSSISSLPEFRL